MRLASETAAFLKLFINSAALSGIPCISKSLQPTVYLLKVHVGDGYRHLITYRLSVSPLSIKHPRDILSPTPFPSVELKCYITLNRHILYGDVLICIQHGACNEKR